MGKGKEKITKEKEAKSAAKVKLTKAKKTGKVGRPPRNDPEDTVAINLKIEAYFAGCAGAKVRPTYCGLAYHLGYTSRQSLWENATKETPISLPLKRALLLIEDRYEQMLGSPSCTGAIFALKNRGWTDKQELEHSGSVQIVDDIPKA